MSREPLGRSPELQLAISRGQMEQTCPDCGRWQAASYYCSWCFRVMRPVDYYRNPKSADAKSVRAARMPATVPANPPPEYRRSQRDWPKAWGEWPGEPASGSESHLPAPI
jgi:hypothetical protein